jgi:hypothetical protein
MGFGERGSRNSGLGLDPEVSFVVGVFFLIDRGFVVTTILG